MSKKVAPRAEYQHAIYLRNRKKRLRQAREYYRANRERVLTREREHWKKKLPLIKSNVIAHYSNGTNKCACCGESTFEFLTMDHINGGGNRQRKHIGNLYIWLARQGYPPGFQVLCSNCNSAKGIYGACPHLRKKVEPIRA